MTAKKTKKQTPQAVLDLIARQAEEIDRAHADRDRCHQLWSRQGDALVKALRERDEYIAMNNKNADAVNHWKEVSHQAVEKLNETEQQVGKLLADAKRARDEQCRNRAVLVWQELGGTPHVAGVFATLEDGKNHINKYHGEAAVWLDGARAQIMRSGVCIGQYVLNLRNVQPQP